MAQNHKAEFVVELDQEETIDLTQTSFAASSHKEPTNGNDSRVGPFQSNVYEYE